MIKYFTKFLLILILFISTDDMKAQKDVTKFLGIPVDGFKSEMIGKLKSKGFTLTSKKDVLNGEFNGRDVNIFIKTNSNKVCRLMVVDVNSANESEIKIRFNNLIQQFQNNKNYITQADSIIVKYTIPEEEHISYEMSINNKQFEAVFYQKTQSYDALVKEKEILLAKEKMNSEDLEKITDLSLKIVKEKINSLNKVVWFMISEINGKYFIMMFYDNVHNQAKGDDL